MKLRKIIGIAAATIALAFAGIVAVGCAQNNEQIIHDQLTKELDSIKNMDSTFVQDLENDMSLSSDTLAQYGITVEEFMKSYLGGFDYSVDNITVNGDTAEATVTLTCKSFSDFETKLTEAAQTLIENATDLQDMTQEEMTQEIGKTMMEALDSVQVAKTQPLTITYKLVDNTWEPEANSQQAIALALMSN